MRYNGFWILMLALLLAASVVPARANLIADPGFESCVNLGFTPPSWTATTSGECDSNPHTGNWDADFSHAASTLSQTITTVTGDNYDFSFWLEVLPVSPDFFTASFGSNEVLDVVNVSGFVGYTLEDFTVTATGTSTTVAFSGETNHGGWILDDVSVTDQGPSAPEPASLVLLGSGLLGIAWRFRHRRTH